MADYRIAIVDDHPLFRDALNQSLGEAIDSANDEMLDSFQCEDFKEGVAHFLDGRSGLACGGQQQRCAEQQY